MQRASRWSAPTVATGGRSACSTALAYSPGWRCVADRAHASCGCSRRPSAPAPPRRSGTTSAAGACGSGARCCRTATPSTSSPRPATGTQRRRSWWSRITTPPTAAWSSTRRCRACSSSAFPSSTSVAADRADHVRNLAGPGARVARVDARTGRARTGGVAAGGLGRGRDAQHRRSAVVPGANDNLSAVAVLVALGRALSERPPRGVRVLLLSTGSEESFMEGMQGFIRRHRGELDRDHTTVLCLECVGSPTLALVEAEGMLRMRPYSEAARRRLAERPRRWMSRSCAGCGQLPRAMRSSRCGAAMTRRCWRRSTRPSSRPTTTGRATRRRTWTGARWACVRRHRGLRARRAAPA